MVVFSAVALVAPPFRSVPLLSARESKIKCGVVNNSKTNRASCWRGSSQRTVFLDAHMCDQPSAVTQSMSRFKTSAPIHVCHVAENQSLLLSLQATFLHTLSTNSGASPTASSGLLFWHSLSEVQAMSVCSVTRSSSW